MFEGFNQDTINILLSLKLRNDKVYFNSIKEEYLKNIQKPLELLYHELSCFLYEMDHDILFSPQKCISSPYTDARFNREKPIKEYFYLRFRVFGNKKKDILGYFFDASADGMKCGINVYNASHIGICTIGSALKRNVDFINRSLNASDFKINMGGAIEYKDDFQNLKLISKEWNGRNSFMLFNNSGISERFFKREIYYFICNTFSTLFPVYALLKDSLYKNNQREVNYYEDFS